MKNILPALFRANLLTKLTYLIISLTIVKIFLVVFSSSLMGYGNNGDFLRQSSCVGIWQSYEAKPRFSVYLEAPVNSLVFDNHKEKHNCISSIDNIYPAIISIFHKIGDKVDFREISLWKIAFPLVMLVFLMINTPAQLNKFAISLAFFLIFGEFVNLLYINTLYFEFSVISSIFFALFWIINLITLNSKRDISIIFSVISIIWLGFSKQQYMPLAALLGLICSGICLVKYKEKYSAVFFLSLSLILPLSYSYINDESTGFMKQINYANKTDTFLWAVLPEASSQEMALTKLGLPAECINGIGKSWYTQSSDAHPCPEVENLSRLKLVGLFLSDPATFINPMHKAIVGIHPFYLTYLGYLEKKEDANFVDYVVYKKTSLSYVMAKIHKEDLPYFVLITVIISALALIIFITKTSNHSPIQFPLLMIIFGGIVIIYSIASSVFGDGYGDLQKHAVGFLIGVSFQIVGMIYALCKFFTRSIKLIS